MGNIVNKGGEIKSSLFGCYCGGEKSICLTPNTYSEIRVGEIQDNYMTPYNYFNTPDMRITPNEYIRSYSLANKNSNSSNNNNMNVNVNLYNYSNQINCNYREEDISKFNAEKYESDPKILELVNLLGENNNFILTEKESFFIKNIVSQNYLVQKLLHYKDNSYYLGFVNKKNNKELYGTYYYNDGSIYKGFFENDKINGRGRLILVNRYLYEGDFEDGLFNGFGKLYTINNIKYEGNWKNDLQDGFGIEHYADGSCYSGMFKKGIKHGKGRFLFKNGDLYEGDFENEEMTGWGLFKRKDGRIYNGMVKNHMIEGIGIFIWKDNKRYIGEYHNELKDGFGIFYSNDGRNYAGFWKEGKQDGPGVVTNIYGQKYYVKFNNGEKLKIPIFSMEEKMEIYNKIFEGEKRINKDNLNKIANDIILQREKEILIEKEKEQKRQKEVENIKSELSFSKSKNSNIKNSKISKISSHSKLININYNSGNINKDKSNKNKSSSLIEKNSKEKDEISNSIHYNAGNSIYSDNGTLLNNNLISINPNSNSNENFKNNLIKICSPKNKRDSNIIHNFKIGKDSSSKFITTNKKYKYNNSCPNLLSNHHNIKNNIKEIEKSKSEIKTRDNSYIENIN